jgi:DNA-binding GntR family transcriptional regulator
MADTKSLIREWESSRTKAHKVAAGIARKIAGKKRYDELPLNSSLSSEYDVSESTVRAAKGILREHGILILEHRRYYVALSRQPPRHQEPKVCSAWKNHHRR